MTRAAARYAVRMEPDLSGRRRTDTLRGTPCADLEGLQLEMAFDTIVLVAAFTAVFAFLWNLHRDMGALRRDMNRNMEGLRQDMNRNLGALRRDMNRGIGGLRQDIGDLRDRVSRVEGMLAGARLKISPDPASG